MRAAEPAASAGDVLVTDDRQEVLRLVDRTLGKRYRCQFATGVDEAREKLAQHTFDLALCDIQMPDESGLILAKEIIGGDSETAVVLITGEDSPEVVEQAFEFRVHGYLVRPFWPGQLLITAMSAMRRRDLEADQRAHSRNLEQRLQTIIDKAPMPIYVKDASRRYLIANAQADELVGLEKGQLSGRTDDEVLAGEARAQALGSDLQVLAGVAYDAEGTLAVGSVQKTYRTVKFPLVDERGEIAALCGIFIDITAQKEALRLRDELTAAQQKAIEELRSSRQETVERLAKAIELHDSSTGEHVYRMAIIVSFLGSQLGLPPERVELLRVAAPMHDVGKIAISDEILRKQGPLTAEERREMERHTVVGHEILDDSKSELLRLAATIALTHHERFDGSGYPQGLAGEEIPLEGRITAVADVFDALLSDRCYRDPLDPDDAIAVIEKGRGAQFDPAIVDLLLEHCAEVLALRN